MDEKLSYLIENIQHEVNTPIAAILGFSDILLNEYRDELGDTAIQFIERIRANALRLDELSRTMLKITKEEMSPLKIQ